MDFGGIIAGAMAGGGQAIQQNAQGQLEQQRTKALAELEQKFRMDTAEYKQDRADERSTAEAIAEAEQARIDRQAELDRIEAEGKQDRITAEVKANLDGSSSGRSLEDVMEARDRELSARIESEIDRMRSGFGMSEEEVDRVAIAREVTQQYADLYPEYSDRLMRGVPERSKNSRNNGDNSNDPLGIR